MLAVFPFNGSTICPRTSTPMTSQSSTLLRCYATTSVQRISTACYYRFSFLLQVNQVCCASHASTPTHSTLSLSPICFGCLLQRLLSLSATATPTFISISFSNMLTKSILALILVCVSLVQATPLPLACGYFRNFNGRSGPDFSYPFARDQTQTRPLTSTPTPWPSRGSP